MVLTSITSAAETASPTPALAPSDRSIFTVTVENDFISNNDRLYTSGVRFANLLPEGKTLSLVDSTLGLFMKNDPSARHRYEVALGQQLFTPSDLDSDTLITDDRPYAAWLYAATGFTQIDNNVVDQVELSFGMVGPAALGEETQDLIHNFIDARIPNGWDNQLENEPTLQLVMQRSWLLLHEAETGPVQVDLMPFVGGIVGNVYTAANAGAAFSIGSKSKRSYGSPRLGLTLPGNGYFNSSPGAFSWQIFSSVNGAYMARNLFLDGNTFRDSPYSIVKKKTLAEYQIGVQIVWGYNRFSFVNITRSKEFESQDKAETYGAFSYSRAY
nr:lipid A deacylase LpxR family protein [Pelagicoccus albus]